LEAAGGDAPRKSVGEDEEKGPSSAAAARRREAVRQKLLDDAGSAEEAFKALDFNGNGLISRSEFNIGLAATLGKDACKSFYAFDLNEDGVIDMDELFPKGTANRAAVSTPDFWGKWCRQNDKLIQQGERVAKWHAEDHDEEIARMLKRVMDQDQSASERRRMKMWIRHLKAEGASDEMIRRLCAGHLPKVPRFTKEHAHKLRMRYNAKITDSVRKVQDTVKDMRELRHSVQKFKESLTEVVEGDRRTRTARRLSSSAGGGPMGEPMDFNDFHGEELSPIDESGEQPERPPPPHSPPKKEIDKDYEQDISSIYTVSAKKEDVDRGRRRVFEGHD